MRLNMMEQIFDGALAITNGANGLTLSGTLASEEVKLQTIFANAPPLFDASGDWSAAPFNFAPLTAFNFDLRVSAARVVWRGRPLTDAAFEFMNEGGRLTATLLEATAYGGQLKGAISIASDNALRRSHATAQPTGADLGALSADFGWTAYSGQGGAQFAFDTTGDSPAALAAALQGKATIQLAAGVVDGVSFEEALRRSERRPIDVVNDMRMGRTVFKQAAATVTLESGGVRRCEWVDGGTGPRSLSRRVARYRQAPPNGPRNGDPD